ncbi:putative protein phosphatase 2C 3 [Acorus calamus]|uniref:Uncharacterized protein n=1 Tax=Acorus calamus TaxID=4465 RepID=A0AAV9D2G8_ACOCL|nr:putative protein phosphatase 2C 3 [Acorus calamus]
MAPVDQEALSRLRLQDQPIPSALINRDLLKLELGDFPLKTSSGHYRCAICQVDQAPNEGVSVDAGPYFSPSSKPWEGPFLCAECRTKKDAMEGKRPCRARLSK